MESSKPRHINLCGVLMRLRISHVFEQIPVWFNVSNAAENHWHEKQGNENAVIIYMNDWHSIPCDFDPRFFPSQTGISWLHVVLL